MSAYRRKVESLRVLSGWKEIATYLGKGVRTVQRYECELGLPVRRPAGRSTGSVVATKAELDGWIKASPIRSSFLLTPQIDDLSQGTTAAIRSNLAEMSRLRDQMMELRSQLRASLLVLRDALSGLQGTLNVKAGLDSRQPLRLPPLTDDDGSNILDLLSDPTRKAS